jgi:nucleotide-binding universal stress UspA family protein
VTRDRTDNAFRILVAIDLKAETERLLAVAQRYGQALNAIMDIIHVAEPDAFVGYAKSSDPQQQGLIDSGREPQAEELRRERQQTQAFEAALRANGVRVGRALTVQGPTSEMILEEARKLGADLLIVGSHQHGALYRFWHGDTVTSIAHQPPCALLVVPI